jgi:hypothetical protein
MSLFGVVEVHAPGFGPCRCGVASRPTITPAAEIMPDRCTPEHERTLAKMDALLPSRRARSLLEDFFPLGDAPEVETIRQRIMHVGARPEHEAVAPPTSAPSTEARSIALAIDGGHVKSVCSYQVSSFEVFVAQVSNDDGKPVVFSSVPAEADRQQQQLRGVLHRLGATQRTPITILSDGATGHDPWVRRRALVQAIMCSIGFISPCVFSMSLRPPRVGRTPRRATARKLPVRPTSSSISVGVSGTAKCSGLSISSETPW